jgi:hypothetical protein
MVNRTLSNRLDRRSEKPLQNNANKMRVVGEVGLAPTLILLMLFRSATIPEPLTGKRNLQRLSHHPKSRERKTEDGRGGGRYQPVITLIATRHQCGRLSGA